VIKRCEPLLFFQSLVQIADNVAEGIIDEVAYMGNLSVYRVRLKSGKIVKATLPNLDRDTEQFDWDEQVYVSWKPKSGLVLLS